MHSTYQQARLARDRRFDGQFFVAVKTTHIFCRPICPANLPLEKNVEYFDLAQQAMFAGYRPCLRCRPDSAPHSFAWQGVHTTVQRASQLLRQYHDLSIEQIAEKLGISSRYFRQLFQQHLGISPKHYQLYGKVLFAKQLLHDSQLSVEHVAQASGFASARRLQQNVKKITGLTPQQIRHKPLRQQQQQQNIRLNLAFRPPFNWPHMRDFLAKRAIDGIEQITQDSYSRTFEIEGQMAWFSATYAPSKHCFELDIALPQITALIPVIQNIERVLDVKTDIHVIQEQLVKSGMCQSQITQGLRLPGVWDTFEAGCRAILGQQISVKSAISLLTQLSHELGASQGPRRLFPSPKSVANSELAFLKIPNSRKQSLCSFATYMQQNTQQPIDSWLDIKGIGPWTVAYAKMRGLSDPDIWLDTDLIIKKQLAKQPINANAIKPWRSYLTLQLWNMS
jgi:AraC family transcriptional regulator of adaptative response / DNA-3-methyladenine glycosylase II